MYKRVLTLLTLFLVMLNAMAQTNCNDYIGKSKKLYNFGQYQEAMAILTTCSKGDSSTITKWQSSRLLAKSYLAMDDTVNALKSAEDLIEQNFQYDKNILEDDDDFMKLINKVKVAPRLTLSLSYSPMSFTIPKILNQYLIVQSAAKTFDKSKSNAFNLGFHLGYGFTQKSSLHVGAFLLQNDFALSYKVQSTEFNYLESLKYLQVPVFFQYNILRRNKFEACIQAGLYLNFLTSAVFYINRKDTMASTEDKSLDRIDLTPRRNIITYGSLLGLGLGYRLGNGKISLEAAYQNSWRKINNSNKRLTNGSEDLVYDYFYLDDDVRLNMLNLSFAYTYYIRYFVQRTTKVLKKTSLTF